MDLSLLIKFRIAYLLGQRQLNFELVEDTYTKFKSLYNIRERFFMAQDSKLLDKALFQIIDQKTEKHFTKFVEVPDEPILKGDYFINLNEDETYGDIQECTTDTICEYADSEWTDNCVKVKLFLYTGDKVVR